MGLFDKRIKKDDFEAPVEEINLSHDSSKTGESLSARERARRAPPPEPDVPDYGIDKAIELMRQLPQDNVELVVRVVKTTLMSLKIDVGSIIKDATRKQTEVQARIAVLRKEIADLESEINTRKAEIGALDADYKETTMVKERLALAEKSSGGGVELGSKTPPIGSPLPSSFKPPTHPPGSAGPSGLPPLGGDSGGIKK